jgi:hypothetical protein
LILQGKPGIRPGRREAHLTVDSLFPFLAHDGIAMNLLKADREHHACIPDPT